MHRPELDAPRARTARLRLMTMNLLKGRADGPSLAALLLREAPDVVALQELTPGGTSDTSEVIRPIYPHGVLDARPGGQGLGLVARFPVEVRRLSLPGCDAWEARVSAGGGGGGPWIQVIAVHVLPPHFFWLLWRRRRQVRALRAHLDRFSPLPRVLLGDLNSTSLFPAYRSLSRRFVDAARSAAARNGGRPVPTWAIRPGWRRLLRIDHALVDPGIRVDSVRVLDLPGSDHAALLVDLSL